MQVFSLIFRFVANNIPAADLIVGGCAVLCDDVYTMKDMSVLQDAPFTDNGSDVEVFTGLAVQLGIKRVIDRINAKAIAA